MRKRLYEEIPENSEILEDVKSHTRRGTQKRLYTQNNDDQQGEKNPKKMLPGNPFLSSLLMSPMKGCKAMENILPGWYQTARSAEIMTSMYMDFGKIALQTGTDITLSLLTPHKGV